MPVAGTAAGRTPWSPVRVAGRAGAAAAVDLGGRGRPALFVASDGGDKVVAHDVKARKFADLTGKLKLGSKSGPSPGVI